MRGWFYLAAEAPKPGGPTDPRMLPRMMWFASDARQIQFVLHQADVAGARLVNRWGPNQIAELHLSNRQVLTVSGPKRDVKGILDVFRPGMASR